MRRWLVIFLLVLLPLQFAWAAAASVCGHEKDPAATHLGHHAHEHDPQAAQADPGDAGAKADANASASAGADADARSASYDGDCNVCHGISTLLDDDDALVLHLWSTGHRFMGYRAFVPDRSPDTLLRPPLTLAG